MLGDAHTTRRGDRDERELSGGLKGLLVPLQIALLLYSGCWATGAVMPVKRLRGVLGREQREPSVTSTSCEHFSKRLLYLLFFFYSFVHWHEELPSEEFYKIQRENNV